MALSLGGCANKTTKAYAEAQTAQQLLDAGDLVGARLAIGRALQLRGDQVDLLLLDGRIKYKQNDFAGAFTSYNMVLSIDPMNPEALQAVSQLGAASGADSDSATATDRILAMDPNNAQALMVKGVGMLNRRDYAGAVGIAERLLKQDPQSEAGLVLKARALNLTGHPKEALALLNGWRKANGPTRMATTALLETARDQGDGELMVEQFRALAELVPHNIDLTLDEANVQYKRGHADEARRRGWALITENGGDHRAMERLVDLWTEYDPTPLSPEQLDQLEAKGDITARLAVARFYLSRGDTATAKALVGTLRGFEPAGLRVRIGYEAGEAGSAAAAETVLTDDKTNCDALGVRALEAIRQHRPADGVVAAQQVASECPDRDGYDLLARAYQAKGDAIGVRNAFLQGAQARPLATEPVARYVAWLTGRGQGDEAVAIARSLTQRAPAKISAWKLFEAACRRAPANGCLAEATAGETAARRTFAIDLPPGERRPSPLLGNSWQ